MKIQPLLNHALAMCRLFPRYRALAVGKTHHDSMKKSFQARRRKAKPSISQPKPGHAFFQLDRYVFIKSYTFVYIYIDMYIKVMVVIVIATNCVCHSYYYLCICK